MSVVVDQHHLVDDLRQIANVSGSWRGAPIESAMVSTSTRSTRLAALEAAREAGAPVGSTPMTAQLGCSAFMAAPTPAIRPPPPRPR
jgi:hypothetical protein